MELVIVLGFVAVAVTVVLVWQQLAGNRPTPDDPQGRTGTLTADEDEPTADGKEGPTDPGQSRPADAGAEAQNPAEGGDPVPGATPDDAGAHDRGSDEPADRQDRRD